MLLDEHFLEYQPLLFSIAYRMLGTVSDAEDIVQDVYLKIRERDLDRITNLKGYLCKITANSSLDLLRSVRRKREVYTGPWLPEPLIFQDHDPYSQVLKGEMISFAVLLLLEKLNPIERAVFILREVMSYEYSDIGKIVDRNETACRKIFSRVKKKLPLLSEERSADYNELEDNEEIIQPIISAITNGNLRQLEHYLANDVTLYTDGGGVVKAAIKPVKSKEFVLRFISHLLQQIFNQGQKPSVFQQVNVNGSPGLLAVGPDQVKTVVSFQVNQGLIKEIYIVRNPEKLKHLII